MNKSNRENPVQWLIIFAILLMTLSGCTQPQSAALQAGEEPVVIRSVIADYDQVWDDLTMALTSRGLVISSVSHVGEMLERTGKALNQNTKIFARANVMEFCSAVISRKMMEANPHYIAFCPYQIMVYSLPEEPEKIYLGYRRLIWAGVHDRKVLQAVETLLSGLIDEVVETQNEYQ